MEESKTISAKDLITVAKEIEHNAMLFYSYASAICQDAKKKKLFIHLAEIEKRHESEFAQLFEELQKKGFKISETEVSKQAEEYINLMVKSKLHPDNQFDIETLKNMTPEQIVWKAIDFENESIVFYEALRYMLPRDIYNKWIDKIVGEELSHVVALGKLLYSY